ncbi:MAG: phospholipid carrier-dependent glycosyltransferase [Candidatus Thermoplasmatota archaeon]|nr:phospholipid carrier-dependent glycosyltransferase [Candidatus Thermoplasmatota archaeon]
MERSGHKDGSPLQEGILSRLRDREFLVRIILPALLILAIAAIPRLFLPGNTFLPNGIDEGIDMMSGRMVSAGYEIYSEVNTVQAPVMITLYGLLHLPPVLYRVLSALASLAVIAFVMFASYRVGGRNGMIAGGAFASLDALFMQQSRLASLDIFTLFFLCAGLTLFLIYRDKGKRTLLAASGVLFALSIMTKLFGVIAAAAIIGVMCAELISTRGPLRSARLERLLPGGSRSSNMFADIAVFSAAIAGTTLLIMTLFGFTNVVQGIFLNQLHRPSDPFLTKLAYLGVFALCNIVAVPFFLFGIPSLYRRKEGILVLVGASYLLFLMVQGKTWIHHFVFVSPFLSISAGIGLSVVMKGLRSIRISSPTVSIRSALALMLILSAFLGGSMAVVVRYEGHPMDMNDSEIVSRLSGENDFVISGDPMTALLAERPTPPNIVNLAYVQYPLITDDLLNETAIDYGVTVVVITYRLLQMEGFMDFVEGNYTLRATLTLDSLTLSDEYEIRYIYALPEDAPLRYHPRWGSALSEAFA